VPETSDPAPTPAASPENLTDPVDEVQLVMKDDDDHDRRERGREHEGEEDDDDD
jgi:hypothetical protein